MNERHLIDPTPELPDNTPIEHIRFPTRLRKVLTAAGPKTVGKVRETADEALLSFQDLGPDSVGYLLYNGILGDKSINGGNVLTRQILAQLPKFGGPKVIYCAGNLLGPDRLRAEKVTVRQTPYEIKVS